MKGKGISYVNEIVYAKIFFKNKNALPKSKSLIQTRGTIRLTL